MTSPTVPQPGRVMITRRQGLGLLATLLPLGLVAACGDDTGSAVATAPPEPSPEPDLAQRVAADEDAMIALYDALLAGSVVVDDGVRPLLEEIREQHRAHRAALGVDAAPDPGGDPTAAARGEITLATAIDAERAAIKGRIRACTEAQDPDLARVLALIGASEAGHVAALRPWA